jgi:hypothetical protein
MDGRNPLLHSVNFCHAQGVAGCLYLAIDVGLCDMVHVNQGDTPYPRSG